MQSNRTDERPVGTGSFWPTAAITKAPLLHPTLTPLPRLLQQHLHRQPIVHTLPAPPGRRSPRINADPALYVLGRQGPPISKRLCVPSCHAVDCVAIWSHEPNCTIIQDLDLNPSFMHAVMMPATQAQKIGRLGLAAVGPVVDVVCVHVALIAAAGEAAALITGVQHSAQAGRDGACFAADVEWLALVVFDQCNHARIAGEATGGFGGKGGTLLEFTTACGAVAKGVGVDMDDELVTVAAAQRFDAVLKEALCDQAQGVCSSGRDGNFGHRRFS